MLEMLKFMGPVGATFGAAAAGACLYLTGIAGPMAFRLFDYSRADRFNRMAIRSGHLKIAGLALIGASCAMLGGAIGGAVSMALAASGLMLARFVVTPQKTKQVVLAEGVRISRRNNGKQKRVAALASTAIFLPPLIAGAALAMYGI